MRRFNALTGRLPVKRLKAICRRLPGAGKVALQSIKSLCNRLWAIGCRWSLLGAAGVTSFAVINLGITFPAGGCLILAYAALKRLRRWKSSGWHFGTATIGDFVTASKAGFFANRGGLIIGRASFMGRPTRKQAIRALASPFTDSLTAMRMIAASFLRIGGNNLIRIHDYVHIAVFASTGAGKGVGLVIPTLLSYFGSCFVTDPKAENYLKTAKQREQHGHTIIKIDPFGLCGDEGTDSINPLDFIDDTASDFKEQIDDLTDALVIISGKEMQPFFPESAKIILGCIIAHVCVTQTDPATRNLVMVRHILKSRHRFNDTIVAMQQNPALGGLIAGMGHQLTWYIDRELAAVQATITRFTAWMDSAAMQSVISTSTFDPRKFRSCKATLYLCLPPHRLRTLAPLTRMILSTMLSAQIRGGVNERQKVLYILDEAAHLAHMQILEDAVSLLRAYGVRLMFFYQSIGQVSTTYGDRASQFLDNIGTQIYFGVNAYESAEAISKRCGDATVLVETLNNSDSFSRPTGGYSKDNRGSVSGSKGRNYSEMGRPLFRPDEVLRLDEQVALLFHRNLPVMPVKLLKYFKEWEFKWGGTAPYRSGVGLRIGLFAVVALISSWCLLVVSFHLPAFQPVRQPVPAASPSFLPPREVSSDGGFHAPHVQPRYGRPVPLPGQSRRRSYSLPPYPGTPTQLAARCRPWWQWPVTHSFLEGWFQWPRKSQKVPSPPASSSSLSLLPCWQLS